MKLTSIDITNHAVKRYLDTVLDENKFSKSPEEIRSIITRALNNSQIPKRFSNNFHGLVEFQD